MFLNLGVGEVPTGTSSRWWCAPGSKWVQTRDAVHHPMIHRKVPTTKNYQSKMSILLRYKETGLYLDSWYQMQHNSAKYRLPKKIVRLI